MPGTSATDVMEEQTDKEPTSGPNESEQVTKNIPTETDLGKRVLFYTTDNKERHGTLRYCGRLEFADGVWCGIELDEATGRNNGSARGIRYFSCDQDHGIFVLLSRVELSRRPSKSGLTRSSSFHNVNAGLMPRKMSVPVTASKPSKAIPHLRKPKAGLLKKSRSEWDLLSGGTNKTNKGAGRAGLSQDRKKELGSYSDLKSVGTSSGENLVAMKRRMLRSTASCANLITIKTVKRGDDEEETDREEWSVNTRSNSLINWPRTSTPDETQSNGAGKRRNTSNTSSSSDSDHTPVSSPTTSTSLKTQYSSSLNKSPNSPTSPTTTRLKKFNRSTDDVFTSHPARVPAPTGLTTHSSHIIESLRGTDCNGPLWSVANRRTHQPSRSAPTTPSHRALMNGGTTTRDGGGKVLTRSPPPVTDIATPTTESLLARIVQLEQIVKGTQTLLQSQAEAFKQQINNVESRLQAKLDEVAKEHKEQLQRLTVDHDEEMRVLQMAHQVNMRDMWKEGQSWEHLGTEC